MLDAQTPKRSPYMEEAFAWEAHNQEYPASGGGPLPVIHR